MRTVETPESIVGLVTRRMLVMTFLEGNKITQLAVRITQQDYSGDSDPCCAPEARQHMHQLQRNK